MVEKFKILSAGRDSKGLNIFKSSAYKEHEQTPMAQTFWVLRWSIGGWLICALVFCFSFIFEHIWRYGWSPATFDWIKIYLINMVQSAGLSVVAEIPYWITRCIMHPDLPCIVPILPFIAYYLLADDTLKGEFNPNGKEIVAKENSVSKLRSEDPLKAYFHCHTDITIPYEEIGLIEGIKPDGERIALLKDGRFVLPGTEELNKALTGAGF